MLFRTVSIDGNVWNNDRIFTCKISFFACLHRSGINMLGDNITFQLYIYIVEEKKGENEVPFLKYLYCLRSYTSPFLYMLTFST